MKTLSSPLLTTVVGSYPQPDWLIDRQKLTDAGVPRVRAREVWRVTPDFLEQAQDDATVVAIFDARVIPIISQLRSKESTPTNRASWSEQDDRFRFRE